MSVDFIEKTTAKVDFKKVGKELKIGNDNRFEVVYVYDSWSDNKCTYTMGYCRKGLIFENESKYICYIVNNSIFSGAPYSECIKIIDKATKDEKLFKLTENPSVTQSSIYKKQYRTTKSDFIMLASWSYEYEYCNYDQDGSLPSVYLPKIDILSDENNIGILLYCEGGHIQFDFDGNHNINMVSRFYDESKKMIYYKLEEITQSDMITYILRANKNLALANHETDTLKIRELLSQDNPIYFSLENYVDTPDSYKEYGDVEEKLPSYSDMLKMQVWNLPIATLNGNQLILNGDYDVVTEFLATYILQGFNLTDSDDINNYYYHYDKLQALGLEIVFPNNIKTIDVLAFINKPLKSIVFEEGIEEILGAAFRGSELQDVKLPNSIRVIGDYAFGYMGKVLESVNIPPNLISIGNEAIKSKKYFVSEDNPIYKSSEDNTCLIDKQTNTIVCGGVEEQKPTTAKRYPRTFGGFTF